MSSHSASSSAAARILSSLKDCNAYLNTTQWHRVALWLLIGLLGIGYGVGLSVATTNARKAADDDAARSFRLFIEWQMTITSHFAKASSLAASVASFVYSHATVPTDWSGNSTERLRVVEDGAFMRLAAEMFTLVPGITALQVHSGGVLSQAYPIEGVPIGLEIINLPAERDAYNAFVDGGVPVTYGPSGIVGGGGGIGIFVRYPIFINTTRSRATFWGAGNVIIRIVDMLTALDVDALPRDATHPTDYALWYTTAESALTSSTAGDDGGPSKVKHILTSSCADAVATDTVIAKGHRMKLPVSAVGREVFVALYPRGGPVSESVATGTIVAIVLVVLFGSLVAAGLLYLALFCHFLYRHRNAPSSRCSPQSSAAVCMMAVCLKGAQPLVEHSPLDAAEVFHQFTALVRGTADRLGGCYAVCEVGDRCVYIVSSDAARLMALGRALVQDTSMSRVVGSGGEGGGDHPYALNNRALMRAYARRRRGARRGSDATASTVKGIGGGGGGLGDSQSPSQAPTVQSVATSVAAPHLAMLRASAGLHVIAAVPPPSLPGGGADTSSAPFIPRYYDAARDAYFYGNAAQLGRLGAVVDVAAAGEVAWSDAFHDHCLASVDGSAARAVTSDMPPSTVVDDDGGHGKKAARSGDHPSSTAGIHVVSLWDEAAVGGDGNDGDADEDDPSVAMAVLSDAYIRRMVLLLGSAEANSARKGNTQPSHHRPIVAAEAGGSSHINMQLQQQQPARAGAGATVLPSPMGSSLGTNASDTSHISSRHLQANNANGKYAYGGGVDIVAATQLTRSATLLHLYVEGLGAAGSAIVGNGSAAGGGPTAAVMDTIRRVVAEERGAVVSAHEGTVVVAFNLMSAGGHHQLRAADAVVRLRSALPQTPFVCSIHHGRVRALVMGEGLVMCTGEVAVMGRLLLQRAVAMSAAMRAPLANGEQSASSNVPTPIGVGGGLTLPQPPCLRSLVHDAPQLFTQRRSLLQVGDAGAGAYPLPLPASAPPPDDPHHGLCLLLCSADLSAAYGCEAVDVVARGDISSATTKGTGGRAHVVYRLAEQRNAASSTANPRHQPHHSPTAEDEWMYQLKLGEDTCAYARANAVFERIAEGDAEGAKALCRELIGPASPASLTVPATLNPTAATSVVVVLSDDSDSSSTYAAPNSRRAVASPYSPVGGLSDGSETEEEAMRRRGGRSNVPAPQPSCSSCPPTFVASSRFAATALSVVSDIASS